MGGPGIGDHHFVHVEFEASFFPVSFDRFEHLEDLVRGHALRLRQILNFTAVVSFRQCRVELEGTVVHFDRVFVWKVGECFFKAGEPDVAPRAGNVRPDINSHACYSGTLTQMRATWFPRQRGVARPSPSENLLPRIRSFETNW